MLLLPFLVSFNGGEASKNFIFPQFLKASLLTIFLFWPEISYLTKKTFKSFHTSAAATIQQRQVSDDGGISGIATETQWNMLTLILTSALSALFITAAPVWPGAFPVETHAGIHINPNTVTWTLAFMAVQKNWRVHWRRTLQHRKCKVPPARRTYICLYVLAFSCNDVLILRYLEVTYIHTLPCI